VIGTALLQSPLALALVLLTFYYALVAAVQRARAGKSEHALVGAAIFATLTAATALWPAVA
jgi:hypothetical protein